MSVLPRGLAVSDDVYTDRIVPAPNFTDRSVVHQLRDSSTTACGRPQWQVPHRIAAGYAALISATWCPRCFAHH